VDAEREHMGGEAIAPQDAIARQFEPPLPPIRILATSLKRQARVPHRDEFVFTRREGDLHPLARAAAQGEGRALRWVEPDGMAALPAQIRQIAGRVRPKGRSEYLRR
jgi:hypothetical protein